MSDIFEAIFSEHDDGKIISIGLTLPAEQNEAAIELSASIAKKFKEEFVLDNDKRPPFVRLYETVFPERNLEKVKTTLEKIAFKMVPIPMSWGTFGIETHNIIIWGVLNEALDLFHKGVLAELNPLREGYYKQKYNNYRQLVLEEERDSLHKWGSPWAANYLPHMVVAKSVNKFIVNELLDLEWGYRNCILPAIIMGEKSPHGGLKEFQIFPFKGV